MIWKMMNSNLQQTVFSVEKMSNVVNVGRCSVYQIYMTSREDIGYLGRLAIQTAVTAANDVCCRAEPAPNLIFVPASTDR